MPLVKLYNRINGITLDSGSGPVDLLSRTTSVGWARNGPQWGKELIRSGELRFRKLYPGDPFDLDQNTNDLWCRGSVLTITAENTQGSTETAATLVLIKHTVLSDQQIDQALVPVEIACQFVDYLGEMNGRGKAQILNTVSSGVPTFGNPFPGLLSPQTLAVRALEIGSEERSLNIDMDGVDLTLMPGTFSIKDNESAATLAAQAAAPSNRWIWVDNQGNITNSERKPGVEDNDPIQRLSLDECVRVRRLPPKEDLATEVAVTGLRRKAVSDALPYRNEKDIFAPANRIYPDPTIGSQVILASKTVISIDQNGIKTTEVTKPLAAFPQGSKSEALEPNEKAALLQYYTVTTVEGIKQYNADGHVVTVEDTKKGIIGAFRRNFQGDIKNILDNPSSFFLFTQLTNFRENQYTKKLPLFKSGYEEDLADNFKNAIIDGDTATNNIVRNDFEETFTPWPADSGFYQREFSNTIEGVTGIDQRAGAPSPERREPTSQVGQELLTDRYEPEDVSSINCGVGKRIALRFDYVTQQSQLAQLARMEFETRIERNASIQITIPMPDWLLTVDNAFPRIDVGEYAYRLSRYSVTINDQFQLICSLELDQIGRLTNPVLPPTPTKAVYPPSAIPVFGPIEPPPNCGAGPTIPPPPTTVTINSIPDLFLTVGVAIQPVQLSAIAGPFPHIFTSPMGLPNGLIIVGDLIVGTPTTVAPATSYSVTVTDGLLNTDSTTFSITVEAVQTPIVLVPYVKLIRSFAGQFSQTQILPYTAPIAIEVNSFVGSFTQNITTVFVTTFTGSFTEIVNAVPPAITVNSFTGSFTDIQPILPIEVDSFAGAFTRVDLEGSTNPFQLAYFFPDIIEDYYR